MKIDLGQPNPIFDAADLARMFDMTFEQVKEHMRAGTITSRFETGVAENSGTHQNRKTPMTSSEQMRLWTGPILFSYGFRPFFLFGAAWAACAMVLWISMLSGVLTLPTRLDPVSWHAHEFLFGYLGAVIAGFLLTAVPNWTGRLPVVGWKLAVLFCVWAAGRILILLSALLPLGLAEAIDLLFPVLLGAVILREIIAGKNWRNLIVLALLTVFALANLLFHIEAAQGIIAAQGTGLRIGVAAALMMISVVGGRIIPSFTRNWLVKAGQADLPVPPMQLFDKLTLAATVPALILWVAYPISRVTGVALLVLGVLHFARLVRWKGYHAKSEPLLWVLHVGYLFVPLGALTEGFAILFPDRLAPGAAQHLWMAGAFGLMTLSVMARATLGHTKQALSATPQSLVMFLCLIGSILSRIAAGFWPQNASDFYVISAILWIGAFAGFVVIFGPFLALSKPERP